MDTTTETWERRGQGQGKGRAAGWPGEGREGGGLPFDPRAPKMLSSQTLPEKSFLDPSTFQPLLGWFYSLVVLPDTVYGSPILQPLSPGPKGIWPG